MRPELQELRERVSNPLFIIGGGTSLEGKDFRALRGRSVLGVNFDMFRPEVTMGIFGDLKFYERFKFSIQAMHCPVVTLSPDAKKDFPFLILFQKRKLETLSFVDYYLSWDHPQVSNAGNTGAAALNLAVLLGIKEVVLIGFDLKEVDGRRNHHEAYNHLEKDICPYGYFRKRFESFSDDLNLLGVKVWNTSMESDLECFEKRPLETFL